MQGTASGMEERSDGNRNRIIVLSDYFGEIR